jgi:hypothetical protein
MITPRRVGSNDRVARLRRSLPDCTISAEPRRYAELYGRTRSDDRIIDAWYTEASTHSVPAAGFAGNPLLLPQV